MDDNRRVLEEIRDLLKRHLDVAAQEADRCRRIDETRTAEIAAMNALATAQLRFYKRVVACSAIFVVALLTIVFSIYGAGGR